MNFDRVSIPDFRTTPTSRRSALFETAGIALVLAVTIGAASITAKPIPNPPSRKTLNIFPPARIEAEEQQREAEKDRRQTRRKAQKKQAKNGNSQKKQDKDGESQKKQAKNGKSRGAGRERRRSRTSEQRNSRP
jgi:type IV secretory pathway VirB10-like protein